MPTAINELFGWYTLDSFPVFKCPRCEKGVLSIAEKSMVETEPAFSKIYTSHPENDPMRSSYRFHMHLVCKKNDCGEIVSVLGESSADVDINSIGEPMYIQLYSPKAFFPAPILISLPKKTPRKVSGLVKAASSVAWSDFNAAANRLRVCAEVLLDELGVSREDRDTLDKRIKRLDEALTDHRDTLNALRYVGNIGSHGEDVTRQVLINSFQLFEYMLEELYGGRKEKMQQIAKSLIETKGRGK